VTATDEIAFDASLARLLRGEAVSFSEMVATEEAFVSGCAARDLCGLVHAHVRRFAASARWPQAVLDGLARELRSRAAAELLRRRELAEVLDQLAAVDVSPILLKGAALAYSVYDSPVLRPRVDTDLIIPVEQVARVRRVMAARGYHEPLHCDGALLFCQFPLCRVDQFGVSHNFDVHWRISTQSHFASVLTYEELVATRVAVPRLGEHAWTAAPHHALLLACVHPVMHHHNQVRLIWLYDVHLLASQLSREGFELVVEHAIARGCGRNLLAPARVGRGNIGHTDPACRDLAARHGRPARTLGAVPCTGSTMARRIAGEPARATAHARPPSPLARSRPAEPVLRVERVRCSTVDRRDSLAPAALSAPDRERQLEDPGW
jgi:hypothetical protein